MQLIRFHHPGGQIHLGARIEGQICDLTMAAQDVFKAEVTSPTWLMRDGRGLSVARELAAHAIKMGFVIAPGAAAELKLDVPVRDVPKLLALAGNFRKHVLESGFQDPFGNGLITPQVFLKPPSTTLNAPGAPIYLRRNNVLLDWEVELAVVIGKGGRDIPRDQATSHVFGYTVINDISERSFNSLMENRNVREYDKFFDWLIGKWFDGSAPLGPQIVTSDELGNPHCLPIRLRLNGETMQNSNTSSMIFDVATAIEYISAVTSLEPGDVIAMGTPEGIGMARGIKLKHGDRLSAEIEGIGVLDSVVLNAEGTQCQS